MTTPDLERPSTWLTADDRDVVRTYWQSVDELDAADLDAQLESAAAQCAAFAPDLPDGAPVPAHWQHAQALQARALWRSGSAGNADQIGMDGIGVTVFPMDWTVKMLLRPKTRPVVR